MNEIYKPNAGFAASIQEERAEQAKQQELKEKHNIKDENVVVVEKPSLAKFLIKLGVNTLKTVATIVILCLAATGLLAFIYPDPRYEVVQMFHDIFFEIRNLF